MPVVKLNTAFTHIEREVDSEDFGGGSTTTTRKIYSLDVEGMAVNLVHENVRYSEDVDRQQSTYVDIGVNRGRASISNGSYRGPHYGRIDVSNPSPSVNQFISNVHGLKEGQDQSIVVPMEIYESISSYRLESALESTINKHDAKPKEASVSRDDELDSHPDGYLVSNAEVRYSSYSNGLDHEGDDLNTSLMIANSLGRTSDFRTNPFDPDKYSGLHDAFANGEAAKAIKEKIAKAEQAMAAGNTDFALHQQKVAVNMAQDLGVSNGYNPFDRGSEATLHENFERGRESALSSFRVETAPESIINKQERKDPALEQARNKDREHFANQARYLTGKAQEAELEGNEAQSAHYDAEASSIARSLGHAGGLNPFDEHKDPMLHRQYLSGVTEVEMEGVQEMLDAGYERQRDAWQYEYAESDAERDSLPPIQEVRSAESPLAFEQRAEKASSLYEQSGTSEVPDTDILYDMYEQSVAMARDIGLDGGGNPNPFSRERQPELHLEYELASEYREEQEYRIFGNPSEYETATKRLADPDKAKLHLLQSRLEERRGDGRAADFASMDAISLARTLGEAGGQNPFSQERTSLLHTAFLNSSMQGKEHNVLLTPGQKARNTWLEGKEADWKNRYDPDSTLTTESAPAPQNAKSAVSSNVVNDLRHLAETLSDPKKAAKAAWIADRMDALDEDRVAPPQLMSKVQEYQSKREAVTTTLTRERERDEELGL